MGNMHKVYIGMPSVREYQIEQYANAYFTLCQLTGMFEGYLASKWSGEESFEGYVQDMRKRISYGVMSLHYAFATRGFRIIRDFINQRTNDQFYAPEIMFLCRKKRGFPFVFPAEALTISRGIIDYIFSGEPIMDASEKNYREFISITLKEIHETCPLLRSKGKATMNGSRTIYCAQNMLGFHFTHFYLGDGNGSVKKKPKEIIESVYKDESMEKLLLKCER